MKIIKISVAIGLVGDRMSSPFHSLTILSDNNPVNLTVVGLSNGSDSSSSSSIS